MISSTLGWSAIALAADPDRANAQQGEAGAASLPAGEETAAPSTPPVPSAPPASPTGPSVAQASPPVLPPSPSPVQPSSSSLPERTGTPKGPLTISAGASWVSLYGTFDANVENVRASGVVSQRTRASSNRSAFGIKGQTTLGIATAWLQMESEVAIDAGGTSLASRNSGVGLELAALGTVMFGQWDSPYKYSSSKLDPFGDRTIGAYSAIMGGGGLTTAGNGGGIKSSFARRVSNVVQYWSPNVAGFSGRLAWGTSEDDPADASYHPMLGSMAVTYDNGPVYALAAAEYHRDFGYLVPNTGHDWAWKAGGSYTPVIGTTRNGGPSVGAFVEQITYGLDNPSYDRRNFNLFLACTYRLDAHALSVSWSHKFVDTINGITFANTQADHAGLRHVYSMSKPLEVYSFAVLLVNGTRQTKDFSNNPLAGIANGPTASTQGAVPVGTPTAPLRVSDLAGVTALGLGLGATYRF